MDPYEDSFETATTATDEEAEKAMSSHSSTSSGDGGSSSGSDSDAYVPRPRSTTRRRAEAMQPPPAPRLPVPLAAPSTPSSLAVPAPLTRTNASSEAATAAALSNTLPAGTPVAQGGGAELPLGERPNPRTELRALNTRVRSQSDSALAFPAPTRETSTAPRSNSAATTSEESGSVRRGPRGMNFEALSNFVAFGGSGSDGTAGQVSQRQSAAAAKTNLAASLSVPKLSTASAEGGAASAEQSGEVAALREAEKSPAPAAAPSPAPTAESPQKAASSSSASKAPSAAPSSSVFSTLSQHLQQQTQQQQQRLAPLPLPAPALTATVPPLSVERLMSSPAAPSPTSGGAPASLPVSRVQALPIPPPMPSSNATTAPAAVSASPLRASIPLPALPPPAWAAPPALATTTDTAADAVPPSSSHAWMIGESAYPAARHAEPSGAAAAATAGSASAPQMPPPLPPRREAPPSELRDASEAVERLVRAFAVLKGYGSLERAQQRGGAPRAAEAAADTWTAPAALHRAGATATVQVRDATRRRGPRVFAPVDAPSAARGAGDGSSAPLQTTTPPGAPSVVRPPPLRAEEQERLAEGLVLDCVLGLLQERQRGSSAGGAGAAAAAASSWRTARPHYELVTADDFTYTVGGRSRAARVAARGGADSAVVYANASSIFSGGQLGSSGAPLFDPRDRQSAVDLYNAVREALEKYVLRRVLSPEKGGTAGEAAAPLPERTAPIMATFAWTLLLDIASLCEEIARVAYDAVSGAPSAVYPVLAQFHGDAACEEVVRTAMHCLPFEALATDSGSAHSASGSGCLFRMACWVTQQQLWTIADAVGDTVRNDMVRRARAQQYFPFAGAAAHEVDPRLIVPPSTPLLTLRPLPGRRATVGGDAASPPPGSAAAAAASYARVREGAARQAPRGGAAESTFDVPAASLEKVAYHVSRLATDLLEDASGGASRTTAVLTAEDYPDVAAAVAETLGELLEDESIKAAVRRRASEKVAAALRARANNATATRQRREQAIIDKAEREAQEVVQRILQEMRAQGVT